MSENNCDDGGIEESACLVCHSSLEHYHNPLLPLAGHSGDVVHLHCARRDSRFGFCWCCGEVTAFVSADLNDAHECPAHAGESIPDYPEEDLETFIEYLQKIT